MNGIKRKRNKAIFRKYSAEEITSKASLSKEVK